METVWHPVVLGPVMPLITCGNMWGLAADGWLIHQLLDCTIITSRALQFWHQCTSIYRVILNLIKFLVEKNMHRIKIRFGSFKWLSDAIYKSQYKITSMLQLETTDNQGRAAPLSGPHQHPANISILTMHNFTRINCSQGGPTWPDQNSKYISSEYH